MKIHTCFSATLNALYLQCVQRRAETSVDFHLRLTGPIPNGSWRRYPPKCCALTIGIMPEVRNTLWEFKAIFSIFYRLRAECIRKTSFESNVFCKCEVFQPCRDNIYTNHRTVISSLKSCLISPQLTSKIEYVYPKISATGCWDKPQRCMSLINCKNKNTPCQGRGYWCKSYCLGLFVAF